MVELDVISESLQDVAGSLLEQMFPPLESCAILDWIRLGIEKVTEGLVLRDLVGSLVLLPCSSRRV